MARSSKGFARAVGRKVAPAPKYSLGDPEEIAQRDSVCFQPEATRFQQIQPGGLAANLNEPDRGNRKSGDFKFDIPF